MVAINRKPTFSLLEQIRQQNELVQRAYSVLDLAFEDKKVPRHARRVANAFLRIADTDQQNDFILNLDDSFNVDMIHQLTAVLLHELRYDEDQTIRPAVTVNFGKEVAHYLDALQKYRFDLDDDFQTFVKNRTGELLKRPQIISKLDAYYTSLRDDNIPKFVFAAKIAHRMILLKEYVSATYRDNDPLIADLDLVEMFAKTTYFQTRLLASSTFPACIRKLTRQSWSLLNLVTNLRAKKEEVEVLEFLKPEFSLAARSGS